MSINPNFISKNLEIYSKNPYLSQFFSKQSHNLHKMRDSCDLCNLTTGPVVNLHTNLLDNVSGLSRLHIYPSNKR